MPEIPTRDLSNKKLKLAFWITSHRLQLRKMFVIFLVLLSAYFYLYIFVKLILLFGIQAQPHVNAMSQLTRNYLNYSVLNESFKAQELQFSGVEVLLGAQGKKNLAVLVKNPNKNFYAEMVDYEFYSGEEVIAVGSTYVYPDSEKYIVALGQESALARDIRLAITAIKWTRTSPEFFIKTAESRRLVASGERVRNIANTSYTNSSFTLTNQSIFSYWNVDTYVYLFNGSKLVSVGYTNIEKLGPLERREVEYNFLIPFSGTPRIEVVADINVLDSDNYMELPSGSGDPK